jgi:hypothetical protein
MEFKMKDFNDLLTITQELFKAELNEASREEAIQLFYFLKNTLISKKSEYDIDDNKAINEDDKSKREKLLETAELLKVEIENITLYLSEVLDYLDIRKLNEINLKISNSEALVDVFKRAMSIDSNALLEIKPDLTLIIKSYKTSRTAVKTIQLSMADIFDYDDEDEDIKWLKSLPSQISINVGIYNLEKVNKFINLVKVNDFIKFKIQFNFDTECDSWAKKMIFKTKLITKDFACANKTLFKYMDDKTADKVMNVEEAYFSFLLGKNDVQELMSISKLEPSSEIVFEVQENDSKEFSLYFKGKSYVITYFGEVDVKEIDAPSFSKDYLKLLDKDDYECFVTREALILLNKQPVKKSGDEEQKAIPMCRLALGRLPENEDDDYNAVDETDEIMDETGS